MSSRSKSTLFLIEQLIVIAVFAICATACVRILTNAYFYAVDSRDVSNALIVAQSGADTFKAVGGDFGKAAGLLGGTINYRDGVTVIAVFYDDKWRVCGEENAHYVLSLASGYQEPIHPNLLESDLYVVRLTGSGGKLVEFPVAVNVSS